MENLTAFLTAYDEFDALDERATAILMDDEYYTLEKGWINHNAKAKHYGLIDQVVKAQNEIWTRFDVHPSNLRMVGSSIKALIEGK